MRMLDDGIRRFESLVIECMMMAHAVQILFSKIQFCPLMIFLHVKSRSIAG